MKKLYIDSCRDDRGFMKATDCLQSHEDCLRGNSIEVVDKADYNHLKAQCGELVKALEKYKFIEISFGYEMGLVTEPKTKFTLFEGAIAQKAIAEYRKQFPEG